jgi:hypothetical protein
MRPPNLGLAELSETKSLKSFPPFLAPNKPDLIQDLWVDTHLDQLTCLAMKTPTVECDSEPRTFLSGCQRASLSLIQPDSSLLLFVCWIRPAEPKPAHLSLF